MNFEPPRRKRLRNALSPRIGAGSAPGGVIDLSDSESASADLLPTKKRSVPSATAAAADSDGDSTDAEMVGNKPKKHAISSLQMLPTDKHAPAKSQRQKEPPKRRVNAKEDTNADMKVDEFEPSDDDVEESMVLQSFVTTYDTDVHYCERRLGFFPPASRRSMEHREAALGWLCLDCLSVSPSSSRRCVYRLCHAARDRTEWKVQKRSSVMNNLLQKRTGRGQKLRGSPEAKSSDSGGIVRFLSSDKSDKAEVKRRKLKADDETSDDECIEWLAQSRMGQDPKPEAAAESLEQCPMCSERLPRSKIQSHVERHFQEEAQAAEPDEPDPEPEAVAESTPQKKKRKLKRKSASSDDEDYIPD